MNACALMSQYTRAPSGLGLRRKYEQKQAIAACAAAASAASVAADAADAGDDNAVDAVYTAAGIDAENVCSKMFPRGKLRYTEKHF